MTIAALSFSILAAACYLYLLHLILKGPVRPHIVLFLDLIVLFLTNVAELAVYGTSIFAKTFYIDDILRQLMVFALVISLVYRALTARAEKRWLGRWLLIGAVLLPITFIGYALQDPTDKFIRAMTNAVRNLSVTAMIMNLVLWTLLIGSRTLDRRLLTITSGLGLQMAGEAIGQSLRLMNRSLVPMGNGILIAAHFLCLLVWIGAFRRPARPAAGSMLPPTASH